MKTLKLPPIGGRVPWLYEARFLGFGGAGSLFLLGSELIEVDKDTSFAALCSGTRRGVSHWRPEDLGIEAWPARPDPDAKPKAWKEWAIACRRAVGF